MAKSKSSKFQRQIIKAEARDRKRNSTHKMKVTGKGVFNLARLIDKKK
jgi:hypothetical protein